MCLIPMAGIRRRRSGFVMAADHFVRDAGMPVR